MSQIDYDSQTIETIALEKFGATEAFREVLEAVNAVPFEIPPGLLPERTIVSPEVLLNETAIAAKVDQVRGTVDQVLADGTPKLAAAIERISWLF